MATAPVNWNNDDIPGWRPSEGFPDLLDRMAEAGYRATEYDDKIGPEPSIVGVEAAKRGIELCGFYQWVNLLDRDVFQSQVPGIVDRLQQLGELGCRHLIIADRLRPERDAIAGRVPRDGSASLSPDDYRLLSELADELARTAQSLDFSTHYHNHVGTYVETPEEVETLATAMHGSLVDFCFDTGHFAYGGGDALHFIERHGGSIGHLHLKDVDAGVLATAKASGISFRDALRNVVFAPLGHGSARIADIVGRLAATGFDGWIVIEQDTCIGDPTETARANLDFVRGVLTKEA
jgi:inosose dehydratase